MSKRRRAKKKRRQQTRDVLPLAKAIEKSNVHPSVTKLQRDKTVTISSNVFIRATAEHCFSILAKQLEEPPQWDPMVIDVKPLSPKRRQIEATSNMTFRLGRKKLATLAMISIYHSNRAISWVSSDKPRVRKDWKLRPRQNGTSVAVTISYDAPRWFLSCFLDRFMRRRQVERDINRMLGQFKEVAESGSDPPNTY